MSFFDRLKTILAKPKKKKIEEVTPAVPSRAQEIILEAREEATRIKKEAQEEAERLRQKEAEIAKRLGALEEKEKYLATKEGEARIRIVEIDKIKQEQVAKLERAAGLTRDEAKNLILTAVEDHLKEDIGKRIREAETQAKEEADRKAREILVEAMRRGAIDYVAEYTVSTVKLTDEDLKGRIIGKEGRNIRAFEMATGVDVDLDEEGVIRLSSFDSIRREIARVALERLIADGRIQPGRIEEIVGRTKKDLEKIMFEEGEKLAHAVGVYNLPADKLALLGRFKYRFSYGQNMITHTLEETRIGVALAQEVKADVNIVRLGCLLHDIGKVITEEEGTHVSLGVDLLRKNGIPQAVIACVEEHHEEKQFSSIESMIVYIADAISGARPGARYEDYEEYLKRLSELENIGKSKEGVKECYAFQAGREIRVIVDPGVIDDNAATILAQKIKEEIEKKLTYPGQVKVTVIRELRVSETAK
ncbi:ribonuclease Y [Candidatus Gottesmanbacteria bacterium]|nr:ribonuclease Y [Candidatus Gottesmanbacteria bacterium]